MANLVSPPPHSAQTRPSFMSQLFIVPRSLCPSPAHRSQRLLRQDRAYPRRVPRQRGIARVLVLVDLVGQRVQLRLFVRVGQVAVEGLIDLVEVELVRLSAALSLWSLGPASSSSLFGPGWPGPEYPSPPSLRPSSPPTFGPESRRSSTSGRTTDRCRYRARPDRRQCGRPGYRARHRTSRRTHAQMVRVGRPRAGLHRSPGRPTGPVWCRGALHLV